MIYLYFDLLFQSMVYLRQSIDFCLFSYFVDKTVNLSLNLTKFLPTYSFKSLIKLREVMTPKISINCLIFQVLTFNFLFFFFDLLWPFFFFVDLQLSIIS